MSTPITVHATMLRRRGSGALLALIVGLLTPLAVLAQDTSPAPKATVGTEKKTALVDKPDMVVVYNRPIVILRATALGQTPTIRARRIEERISGLIEQGKTGNLTTGPRAEGTAICLDGEFVMTIAPEDVDPLSGETLEQTVTDATKRLRAALDSAGRQHSAAYLFRASIATLIATLLYVVLVWGSRLTRSKLLDLESRWQEAASQSLGRLKKQLFPQLLKFYRTVIHVIFWVVVLAATDLWLTFSLRQFPYTEPWGDALGQHLIVTLRTLGLGAIGALPGLFVAAVILTITHLLTKLARMFFTNVRTRRIKLPWIDPDTARPTGRIVIVLMWAFALVMVYPYLPGSDSAAFKGIGVFLGLLLSLGGSGIINQVMGGFALMYTRALKMGEYVRVGEHEGIVEEVGFIETHLRTIRNERVSIPNALMMTTLTTNYSRLAETTRGVMAYTKVTIGYDAPWRQVHAMLIRAAEQTPGIQKTPAPSVFQRSLADFYVEYELNFCLEKPAKRIAVLSDLCANIQDEFNKYGVQILSPHFMANPPDKVWVPKEKWHEPPAEKERDPGPPESSPAAEKQDPNSKAS